MKTHTLSDSRGEAPAAGSRLALVRIVMHGSQMSARTRWQTWAGFTLAHLSDGSTRYFPERTGQSAILAALMAANVCTADFQRGNVLGALQMSYPPRPEFARSYQHNYGYEMPATLGDWSWSTTFGRWGRLVTFADGWHGFTYPRIDRLPDARELAAAWLEEHFAGLCLPDRAMAEREAIAHFSRQDVRKY